VDTREPLLILLLHPSLQLLGRRPRGRVRAVFPREHDLVGRNKPNDLVGVTVGCENGIDAGVRDGNAVQLRDVNVTTERATESSLILDDAGRYPDDLRRAEHPSILVLDAEFTGWPIGFGAYVFG
jgi:hypothetical protein